MRRIMLVRSDGGTNAGDLIQSIALSRLIGQAKGFFRDQPHLSLYTRDIGVAAGFFCGPIDQDPDDLLFAGIYWLVHGNNVNWLKISPFPVGARDPETFAGLRAAGVKSELIGCATLTLPRYTGPRSGEVSVDFAGPGEHLSHALPPLPFDQEWEQCLARLDTYRRAALVHTTRLHVALPCAAMGTPVRYMGTIDGRTSILAAVGIKHGVECQPDATEWREKYIAFLTKHLGPLQIQEGPCMPILHPALATEGRAV